MIDCWAKSMKRSCIVGLLLLLPVLLLSCSQRHFPGSYLRTQVSVLESYREEWIKQNRSSTFDVSHFAGPQGACFAFTNTVSFRGRPYKCLFGARRADWPPGVLAITEDGFILWIHDQGGEVTFAPEMNGVDW